MSVSKTSKMLTYINYSAPGLTPGPLAPVAASPGSCPHALSDGDTAVREPVTLQ